MITFSYEVLNQQIQLIKSIDEIHKAAYADSLSWFAVFFLLQKV